MGWDGNWLGQGREMGRDGMEWDVDWTGREKDGTGAGKRMNWGWALPTKSPPKTHARCSVRQGRGYDDTRERAAKTNPNIVLREEKKNTNKTHLEGRMSFGRGIASTS